MYPKDRDPLPSYVEPDADYVSPEGDELVVFSMIRPIRLWNECCSWPAVMLHSSTRRLTTIFLAGIALLTIAAGCSSPSSPSFNADEIEGTWTLQSIAPAGGQEQTTPAGASYTLTLTDDRVSTRADCNTCAGSVAVAGHTLTIGPQLACTRAACPTMAFENAYVSLLAGDSTPQTDGNTLALTSSRGVLRFRR